MVEEIEDKGEEEENEGKGLGAFVPMGERTASAQSQYSGGRGRWVAQSSRPAWSTE